MLGGESYASFAAYRQIVAEMCLIGSGLRKAGKYPAGVLNNDARVEPKSKRTQLNRLPELLMVP